MRKVYALYFKGGADDFNRVTDYTLKISSEKMWLNQTKILEDSEDSIVKWNYCHYLSFSRAALVKKAKEIKEEWIQELKSKIEQVEAIVIK